MQYSIRHRLTVTFIALAVLPLLVVGIILVWYSFTVQQQQAISLQNELTLHVSSDFASFIEKIEEELRLSSQLQALPKLTYEEQEAFLSKLQSSLDVIEELILLDKEGQELVRVVESVTTDDLDSQAEAYRFLKSQENGESYYSEMYFDGTEPLMTIAIPLVDVQNGEWNGVLVADIRLQQIWDLIASIELTPNEPLYLVDGKGQVIAHRNPSVVLGGTSFDVPQEDGIQQGLDSHFVVLAVEWLQFGQQRFAIVTERSLSEAFALTINTLLIMGAVILFALLVARGLAAFVVNQIVQPIQSLAFTAQAIKEGDFSQQVEVSNQDEIGLLAQAFNGMTAENARLFEQKEQALELTRLRLKLNEVFIGLRSEQDVLDRIMEEASFHKDARVMLLLLESEGEEQKFVLVDGRSLESGLPILPKGLSFPFKSYPLSQYTTTQALFVTNNILTDERIDEASRAVMKRTGTVSLLTAQLAVGKELYGLLSIASKESHYFDEHKIALYQILAERGGLALHEARLRAATEEARAEAEHEGNLLNSILSTLPVGVYVSDKEGKAIRSNKMARILLGQDIIKSPEEDLTELYNVVYSENGLSFPQENLPLVKTLADGLPHSRDDIAVMQPNGTKVDLLVNSGPLVDQKGETIGATVVFSDISQRRRVEEALAGANLELIKARDELELRVEARTAELAQLNHDLENLLYIISHDLKEPLRSIQNFSRLVIRRYSNQLDAKGQDYLERVDRAGARLRTLIDDILTLSRAQRMELQLEAIASEKIVLSILERLDVQIQESEASIKVAKDLPELQVNRTWATQAIYNLISNALKYKRIEDTTGKAQPPELEITCYEGGEGIGLVIKDRGPGVPKEYAERIFQLFQRAVGREIEGTGAGLTIVRQIAQRHGGHAWVQAREGGGSEFIITFGQAKASSLCDDK